MNRLSAETRTAIVKALVEGNSLRATARMTDTSKNTVTKLLVELGEVCGAFMNYNFCRVHKTLGTTPAVAAGVADHVWHIREVIDLLVEREKSAKSN